MTLIVGLGNPGDKYKNNRHNVGFMVIDELIYDHKPQNISKDKFKGELFKSPQALFLKPQTFMNLSGQSVVEVANFYKIEKLIVIHDDLDLNFGALRFKFGGGHGGHNGLKSIGQYFGNGYLRVRMGISKPQNKDEVASYVLNDFPKNDSVKLKEIVNDAKLAALELINKDLSEVCSTRTRKD